MTTDDRLAIAEAARDAIWRYAAGADQRDWELLGSAFAPDAVLEMMGEQTIGREAIVATLRAMLPADFGTRHLIVNPRVEVNDGRAVVEATVYYLHDGTGYEATGWGTYRDEVAVVDGIGTITRKTFTPIQHLPGNSATLAARLERLETAELAREATWRYARAVDAPDLTALAAVFTEDAVLASRSGERIGRDEVIGYYERVLADPVARRHHLTNQSVRVLGPGRAEVTSSFIYTYAGADTSIIGWGDYVDLVRIEDGEPRIERKTISVDMTADTRTGWADQ